MRYIERMLKTGPKPRPISVRFWEKVRKRGADDCWEWTANRLPRGYGLLGAGRRGQHALYAHRLSWELHNGQIPAGQFVLHRCDNPPCVNPAHLFLGTHTDNMRDMHAKRRGRGVVKTHCVHGHEFTVENTRTTKRQRYCIACEKEKGSRHYQQNREKVLARSAERFRATMAADPEKLRKRSRESMQRQRDRRKAQAAH
jgi:hypothetical protein